MKTPVDSTLGRAVLRREKLAARLALDASRLAEISLRIEDHLATHLLPRPPACIGFCAPVKNEFDAHSLMLRLISAGWRACMPVVEQVAAPMVFREWTPDSVMTTDRHGIPIPDTPVITEVPTMLLLPLLAFDAEGYRLGYGGGYFDRTLAAFVPRPLAIGVGPELARVATVYPQVHDQRCDAIVTEEAWWDEWNP